MSFVQETAHSVMENNRYKSKCPAQLSFNYNGYQSYGTEKPQPSPATQEAVSILSKMNHRVNDDGFYLPTPSATTPIDPFTFKRPASVHPSQQYNRTLPPASPLTPSCAYYKSSTPRFVYPEDLLPPTSLFTKSIAGSMMAEEMGDDKITRPRSHDIASILSLPQDNWDTESYDLFDNVCTTETPMCYSYSNFHSTDFCHRPADDIAVMNNSTEPRPSLFDPEYFTKQQLPMVKKESSAPKPTSRPKSTTPVNKPKPGRPAHKAVPKPFKCDYCPKVFNHRSALNVHTRIHTGVRPYTCQVCDRSFSDNSTYVKHLRTHTNEKPYSCDICCKSFSQSGNLTRHKKTHQ